MELRDDIEVGVASHTGPIRSANEDDYFIFEPRDDAEFERHGRLFVIADGMGGAAGGAEASRIAVRSFASVMLGSSAEEPSERIVRGFEAAASEVFEASRANPQLADMGTTMTALCLHGDRAIVGHVGDSRCVVVRAGKLLRLTEDHAVVEPRHLLTRCLGAGREREDVDVVDADSHPGDVFALMTDGVWGELDDATTLHWLKQPDVGSSARGLVEAAFEAGSTDNATVVVVRLTGPNGSGTLRTVDLSADESGLRLDTAAEVQPKEQWPWVLFAFGLALSVLAVLKLAGFW